MSEFMACNCSHHRPSVSKYPKNQVPSKMFLKNESDVSKGFYKLCIDCRKYGQASKNKTKEKGAESRELVESGESDFLFCEYPSHSHHSAYKRDEVPKILFLKDPTDKESDYYKYCLNCREHFREYNGNVKEKIKEIARQEGKLYCSRCNKVKTLEEMALNRDGKISKSCIECKIEINEINSKRRICFNNIRLEFIQKSGSSCQRCKKIFLKPIDDSLCVRELNTYDRGGVLMVDFENKSYVTSYFLLNFKDLLEIKIIDLDHLPEEEQRKRNILKPNEPYVEKIEAVSAMGGEDAMRKEARKCQNLCKKCHIIVTIERERGCRGYTFLEREKREYVDEYKIESKGCISCGFFDKNILKFLHLDHIDPKTKIDHVAQMVYSSDYSLDDVIEECDKTRVLCVHCHMIHTCNQKADMIIL